MQANMKLKKVTLPVMYIVYLQMTNSIRNVVGYNNVGKSFDSFIIYALSEA